MERCAKDAADAKAHIASARAQVHRVRADARKEVDRLTQVTQLLKDDLQATAAKLREWEALTDGPDNKPSDHHTRKRRRTLAEDMLLVVQNELDAKATELEQRSAECDRIIAQDARLQVRLQTLARERETAVHHSEQATKRAAAAERELVDVLARNAQLERRIVLLARRQANRPPDDHAEPDPAAQTTPTPTHRGQPQPTAHVATPLTPAEMEIAKKLEQLRASYKAQQDLVSKVVAQSDQYRLALTRSAPRMRYPGPPGLGDPGD